MGYIFENRDMAGAVFRKVNLAEVLFNLHHIREVEATMAEVASQASVGSERA